ncbi:hypothetical protein CFIMG_003671RA [Ceratocystis fimbriata CBS 114723]|uniref:Uncharacterized protein n=1 Tax=Ceratocystis fimbriata CBS 114723 TaxID=1035309 RepID=A0A2C5WX72_9PEZI|nr:hypothetical protein CFIMG_003671RA [Ceratocystis fimbriata CBS 114723]
MADTRDMGSLKYGYTGNIIYIPKKKLSSSATSAASETSVGELHASRRVDNSAPSFRIKSSWELCYTSSSSSIQHPDPPDEPPSTFSAKRVQKRWLQTAHPQTFAGISALSALLDEETQPPAADQICVSDNTCFEIGEIADVTGRSRSRGAVPVIAKTSGSGGEILHIIRLQDMWFQWKDSKNISIRLRNMSLLDKQEEVFWSQDAVPITAIKFAVDRGLKRHRRWIMVQKRTGTTILQPEHHSVPVPVVNPGDGIAGMASRIDPRPLFTVASTQTGGHAHSDMAFTPTRGDQKARLAIIDEMGYWSVWSIHGSANIARNTVNVSMQVCGHIGRGILPNLLDPIPFPAQKHGIILCRVDRQDVFFDTSSAVQNGTHGLPATQTPIIFIWNSKNIAAFDIDTAEPVEPIPSIPPLRQSSETILDAQIDPVSENRIVVLTSRHIFWVEFFCNAKTGTQRARILTSASHCTYLNDNDVQMTTSSFVESKDMETTLVMLHSLQTKTVKSFWLRNVEEVGLVQLYQSVSMVDSKDDRDGSAESIASAGILRLANCPWGERDDVPFLDQAGKTSYLKANQGRELDFTASGFKFREKNTQFRQLFSLSRTGQIGYWICAIAPRAEAAAITAPDVNVYAQANRWSKIIKKRKQACVDFITPAFVIPDGLGNFEELAMRPLKERSQENNPNDSLDNISNSKRLKRKFFLGWLQAQKYLRAAGAGPESRDKNLSIVSERIFAVVRDGVRYNRLPYRTLIECINAEELLETHAVENDQSWSSEIMQSCDFGHDSPIITAITTRPTPGHVDVSAQLDSLRNEIAQKWPIPKSIASRADISRFRQRLMASIARDAVLATNAVFIRDLAPPGRLFQDELSSSQSNFVDSSQVQGSSPPRFMSHTQVLSENNTSQKYSQKESTASINERKARGREAIHRLSQYAISIETEGDLQETAPHQILGSWPKELGISTDKYISSQAMVHVQREEEIRKKHQAIQAKKRRQALKYGIISEDSLRSSQTVGSAFSQAQTQNHIQSPAAPRINAPVVAPSTQVKVPAFTQPSSQPYGTSQIAMSQPVAGIFGGRDALKLQKKKKKKKGGIK